MDFTAFYAKGDLIYKVVGTNKKKDLQIYNEAMRLGLMPEVEDLKIYGQDILQKVKDKIKVSQQNKGDFRNPRGAAASESSSILSGTIQSLIDLCGGKGRGTSVKSSSILMETRSL